MEPDKILVDRLNELIQVHEALVLEHSEFVTKYKNTLADLLGTKTIVISGIVPIKAASKPKAVHRKKTKAKSKPKTSGNIPLKDIAIKYIEESDVPLSANSLREKYNEIKGIEISIPNFSPRIAELTSKGVLIKCIIEGNPIKSKFLYALPRMMENGALKEEYLEKAKAGGELQLF